MTIWLWIACCAYLLGVILDWQQYQTLIQEWDEYSNFPIVWMGMVVVKSGCVFKAFTWVWWLIGEFLFNLANRQMEKSNIQ